jgi:hypothetical protein
MGVGACGFLKADQRRNHIPESKGGLLDGVIVCYLIGCHSDNTSNLITYTKVAP